MTGSPVDGIVIVDKPAGWTSHDVVAVVRRRFGTRKVGHCGTLDPDATGVLVLGVGKCTRLLTYLTGLDKTYRATIRFGVETSTLDAAGEVTVRHDMSALDPAAVVQVARSFVGEITQIPPMVSAIKVGGRRLHELAREGVEVERAPRRVTIHSLDLWPTADPLAWEAEVHCSSGTYIRTLAADLGHALGGGAHIETLRRLSVGPFAITEAGSIDESPLLPPVEGVRHLSRLDVGRDTAAALAVGKVQSRSSLGAEGHGPWAACGPDGDLLAICVERGEDGLRPAVVLAR